MRLRLRFTFFFISLSTMKLKGYFFVCSKSVSLFVISSVTMINNVLHFIFRRSLCSVIVLYNHYFLTNILLLSSLRPFAHPYLLYVVWNSHPSLPALPVILELSDPVLAICTRDTLLWVARDSTVHLHISMCIIPWLISFCPRKTSSAFSISVLSLLLMFWLYSFIFGHLCVLLLVSASLL